MTSLRRLLRDRDAEALYWLDLAKRVIGGEISPDDALQVLKLCDETLKRATTRSRVVGLSDPRCTDDLSGARGAIVIRPPAQFDW